jgi:hypothetical protein
MLLPGSISPGNVVHELFHAFQYAFKIASCDDYQWWKEASAQWSENYVLPTQIGNEEHAFAPFFFADPGLPLEYGTRDNDNHWYGAYLFPFFAEKTLGADVIRQIMVKLGSEPDSLKAINSIVPFDTYWKHFVLDNWNRSPWDFYNQWDPAFPEGAYTSSLNGSTDNQPIPLILDGNGNAILNPDVALDHLSARYFDFDLSSSAVRSLAFNSLLVDPAHIEALVRIAGSWRDDGDWSAPAPPKFFCRDFASEKVDEVVLIASNSSHDRNSVLDPGNPPPTLAGTNIGCRRWVGSFSGTAHRSGGGDDRTETWSGNATFERQPGSPSQFLPSTSASITWSMHETLQTPGGDCTYTAGPATLTSGSGSVDIPGAYSAQDPRAYHIGLGGTADVPAHAECPGPTSYDYTEHPYSSWLETAGAGFDRHAVKADGGTGDDTSSRTDFDGNQITWHWNFTAPQ